MSSALLISVRVHDGRYHGAGDWPPAPARLFQAFVAGAGLSGPLRKEESAALGWLERRPRAPLIAAPIARAGQTVTFYVPRNDSDLAYASGDLDVRVKRLGEMRNEKRYKPLLFNAAIPFLYAWSLDSAQEDEPHSQMICALAERVYQLGRSIDIAWAWGDVIEGPELDDRLSTYRGCIYRPSSGGNGQSLACPQPGSLESLVMRYQAYGRRFETARNGKKASRGYFTRPPRPSFEAVAYDSPPGRRVYELRDGSREDEFASWPLTQVCGLVEWLRDGAADRMRRAFPDRSADIERVLVGRRVDGRDDGPTSARVRIVPLPSIGHQHAGHEVRRVLVEVPTGCALRADHVHWAFSGCERIDPDTGVIEVILTPSTDENMLKHYGVAERASARVWRTVTPAALPESAKRRRIDPARVVAEAKDGAERAAEQARAAAAVTQALRHAEVRARVEAIRVQREPFEARGERVEAFAPGTRFAKERLWHVEITFNERIDGPLVIGDGRFVGLGVMAPAKRAEGVHAFVIESGLGATPQPTEVARALRRAVMARAQDLLGAHVNLPTFFTGHERDGSVARTAGCPHLTFVFDPVAMRLLIVAPHVVERRVPTSEEILHLENLDEALADFGDLRAGSSGRLLLRASAIDTVTDPLFAASHTWNSVTLYEVTRHAKRVGAEEALSVDVRAECRRHGLPTPRVTAGDLHGGQGVGLVGRARLTFDVAVEGPIVLGRSRHLGGGLFAGRRAD
jgi:CRISPR-associated protein Csb2